MKNQFLLCFLVCFAWVWSFPCLADDVWLSKDSEGRTQVQMYFFWSKNCPHCAQAHPFINALAQTRPWVKLHALEVSGNARNLRLYETLADQLGAPAVSVPAMLFCREMHVGWNDNSTTGKLIRERLDACYQRTSEGMPMAVQSGLDAASPPIHLPLIGSVDAAHFSLPVLTLTLAGLDAFNPCAFFVLLFLLSMMAHQKSRSRMVLIGGVFVAISGLMYFAFMAAWLNVFQLFGHLAAVTMAAGALAVGVGLMNVKDFFWFEKGLSLSIPDSRKPELFRRTRAILGAENLPAMLVATVFLAMAANFYELLCTAGFPMVYTRLLTLADVSVAARYGYLAAYNAVYVVPLSLIVLLFARSLGARKLSEREGRLLKLMSGVMMLELGALLLLAPNLVSQLGIAFGLMLVAIGMTWIAARLTRPVEPGKPG